MCVGQGGGGERIGRFRNGREEDLGTDRVLLFCPPPPPLLAFQNYDIMQKAACLADPQTNVYCYLEAVSILTNDAYLYNLPLGTQ